MEERRLLSGAARADSSRQPPRERLEIKTPPGRPFRADSNEADRSEQPGSSSPAEPDRLAAGGGWPATKCAAIIQE